ncbi:HAD family hydrolase [Streptomyces lateritius]|uniref:HAD family hydrolase n=1 Tax=Streptomyces lateritius TaxID=67313 RepID=A0ABW6YF89_9ACTN
MGGVLAMTPETGWVPRWERHLTLPPGTVHARLGDVWRAGSVGAIGEDEVRARVATDLGLDASQVDAFMADLWHEYLGTPNDELIGCVRGLRRRCTLGILSNSFVGARERETASYHFDELDELVEHIVHSHEIGINKPDPRAFHLTCDHLGVRPEDCLFIDDAEVNVEAARGVGMQGHLFEGNAETVRRIERHLEGRL